jgi:ribonuclease BN (tRNA processing enzyme)
MKFFYEMNITFVEYNQSSTYKFQDLEIQGIPVIHSPESNPHGVRITIGEKIFCYSGDTEWTNNLYLLCENADMFICECNYFEKEVKGHLSYTVVKEKFGSCTAKRVLLTHYGANLVNHLSEISIELTKQDKTYLI